MDTLSGCIREFLGRSFRDYQLADDEDIFSLGFVNSLFAMELVMFIEKSFGARIPNNELKLDPVDAIANAVLYEGYLLYPYRQSSVKNQVRWTFGGVHPKAWSEATGGSEPWLQQTQCLVTAGSGAAEETSTGGFRQPVSGTISKPISAAGHW